VGTGGGAVAKNARRGRGKMVIVPKRGRLRDPAPGGQAIGGVRGLVAPAICPTEFASECVPAFSAPPMAPGPIPGRTRRMPLEMLISR
jgi:hypothetical protein